MHEEYIATYTLARNIVGIKESVCDPLSLFFTSYKNTKGVTLLVTSAQRTILFLIADTGAGHRSAANAITNAIKLISQNEQEEWQAHQRIGQADASQFQQQAGDATFVQFPPPTYRI